MEVAQESVLYITVRARLGASARREIERANADGARGGPHNEKGDAGPL